MTLANLIISSVSLLLLLGMATVAFAATAAARNKLREAEKRQAAERALASMTPEEQEKLRLLLTLKGTTDV